MILCSYVITLVCYYVILILCCVFILLFACRGTPVAKREEVSCAKWATLVGTKPIEGAVKKNLKKGDIVFEYDFKKFGSKGEA